MINLHKKGRCLFAYTFLIILMVLTPTITASPFHKNIDIDKEFEGKSTLLYDEDFSYWDSYDFNLSNNEKVTYVVEVDGTDEVYVYLVPSHNPNSFDDYAVKYSSYEPINSFSMTFSKPELFDSNEYSIVITNGDLRNVTYRIHIRIEEEPESNFNSFCIVLGIAFVLVFLMALAGLIYEKFIKKKGNSETHKDFEK